MQEQDISIEQVLEIAKTELPGVDDEVIIEQFNMIKNETGLSNYETLLFIMKSGVEKQKGDDKTSALKRIAGRGKGPQQPQELDMEMIKRLINEGNV